MGYGASGPGWRDTEPSRFLGDLPPELFGLPARAAPPVRRHPGALPGEPFIEMDGEEGPTVDYSYDQRPESSRPFQPGQRVAHETLGEGVVRACDGAGPDAKGAVAFHAGGERRLLARFLRRA